MFGHLASKNVGSVMFSKWDSSLEVKELSEDRQLCVKIRPNFIFTM